MMVSMAQVIQELKDQVEQMRQEILSFSVKLEELRAMNEKLLSHEREILLLKTEPLTPEKMRESLRNMNLSYNKLFINELQDAAPSAFFDTSIGAPNGSMAIDGFQDRLYVRVRNAWKYAGLA